MTRRDGRGQWVRWTYADHVGYGKRKGGPTAWHRWHPTLLLTTACCRIVPVDQEISEEEQPDGLICGLCGSQKPAP